MSTVIKYILKFSDEVIKWAKANLSVAKFKELYAAIKGGITAVQKFCGENSKTCWTIFWEVISNLI